MNEVVNETVNEIIIDEGLKQKTIEKIKKIGNDYISGQTYIVIYEHKVYAFKEKEGKFEYEFVDIAF